MQRQKDIFDLFREGDHSPAEQPSQAAWRKLERRLDSHKKRSKTTYFRALSMVAAVLLLIVMVLVISFSVTKKSQQQATAAIQIEQLNPQDTDWRARQVMEFSKQYKNRSLNIQEGKPNQKLIVRP